MKRVLISILFLLSTYSAFGQSQPVSFSSEKLQEISQQYAGSALNWPIVLKLADHNLSSNTFTLSSASLLKLNNLALTSTTVNEQQQRINQLISEGATIFAAKELQKSNESLKDFLEEVRKGNLDRALEVGSSLKAYVDALEQTLTTNRLVSIQAQLSKKDGKVDKRIGLLANWQDASVGDLFEESDGVRTQEKSYATLTFTDGSNIIVNPKTTATIRKSRIDKLDESSDTEITLVEGGLLSKLSALGKEKSNYVLNAGSSTTTLKSQNFYAENRTDGLVKLSNYDGDADVSANNVIVTIKKNEGTLVRANQPPLKPVKLLPSPQYYSQRNDTIIYKDNFLLSFREVDKAEKYNIEYSTSYNFNTDVNSFEISDTRFLLSNLPLGTTYVRVQSVDELGLRGPFSEALRIIRNEDTKAPPVFGDLFSRNISFSESIRFKISGVTEPDAKVMVGNQNITPSNSGEFTTFVMLDSYDQTIVVSAVDGSQNKTVKEVRVARLSEDYLFDIRANGLVLSNEISSANSTKTITGKAFPEMEVELDNNGNKRVVKTDSQGRWGVTMNVQQGKLSITFKTNQKSTATLTKTYTVK